MEPDPQHEVEYVQILHLCMVVLIVLETLVKEKSATEIHVQVLIEIICYEYEFNFTSRQAKQKERFTFLQTY